ncbi:MAG: hypothetical protein WCL39_05490 [Armatimonadota bacterium]
MSCCAVEREQKDDHAGWRKLLRIRLLHAIIRDAQGNIIPLSQRFNPASDSILQEQSAPYQGFRLRPAGATRYANSNTGVLFADGHEIKTTAAAPGEIPAGGGMLWDRLRETSRRSALLDTWQAVHDDPAYTEWLVDLLDRAPSGRDFNLAPARFLPSTMNSCWVPVDSFSNTSMPVCEFFSNPKHGCPVE